MKPTGGGTVDMATAVSGEKLLRSIMADNKLELYGTYVCMFTFQNITNSYQTHTLVTST